MENKELKLQNIKGAQKAAIFLLSMGENYTANIFKTLDEISIKKIGRYMSKINYVSSDVLNSIMRDFTESFENDSNLTVSGKSFLEEIISKTMDEDTAREIFLAIGSQAKEEPFSDFKYIPAENLVHILKGEHPQTIALILSQIPMDKAAEIMNILPEKVKSDVAFRVVNIGDVQEDTIRELDDTIKSELFAMGMSKRKGHITKFDGTEALANILNEVDKKTEELVLSSIEEYDPDLAEKIRQKMFVFEDLVNVDDKSFREILKNIDNQSLVKALKTASDVMKQKVFVNLSENASTMLKEDMEFLGPVRLKDVELAQQEIIKTAKRLEAEEKIVLNTGKGKEDVFV
jgi:flagellar motor switch protein FliG